MCGIAGKVFSDTGHSVDEKLLRAMCREMEHRGPDDEGYFQQDQVGLCMRRLKVIDLVGGHQPMSNEDESVWIVFNGEIYNYRQLRQDLEKRGHHFRTASDTETIIHLYEEKGTACLQELRGMFSMAIWAREEQSLLLARDRLGIKPLYYACGKGALSFASELGPLLCDPQIDRKVDPQAVDEYLNYLFVPHPRTIYRNVLKLPPASYAVYAKGELQIERYWDVRYEPARDEEDGERLEKLDELLKEAVELRMLADVPVGAFLSGGLDSSLIVALMQKVSNETVRTFSIGFEESSFDELGYARQVAGQLGTLHEEYVVGYDIEETLPRLVKHFGEPFADSSAIPTYHLSRMTRNRVTVALSGDGGDEVFGGYRRYQARLWADLFNRVPRHLGRAVCEYLVAGLGEPATYYGKSFRKKLKRFVEFAAKIREAPQTSWAFFLPRRKKTHSIRQILPMI